MSKGGKFALIAVGVCLIVGVPIAPFFCERVGIDPFNAGKGLGLLTFLVGGLAFMVGNSLEQKGSGRATANLLRSSGNVMQASSESSRIIVTAVHSPFGFIYGLVTPTIAINGQRHRRPWGTHSFDVTPGNYEISVSYPWLFLSECGKNSVKISLQPGELKRVTYRAGFIRYLPGKIAVA